MSESALEGWHVGRGGWPQIDHYALCATRKAHLSDLTVETLDLRDHPLPFFDGPQPPRPPH